MQTQSWTSSAKKARILLILTFLFLTLSARQARADRVEGFFQGLAIASTVGVVLGGTSITFTVYDAVVAGRNQLPTRGWGIAETVLITPQALFFNGGVAWAQGSGEILEKPIHCLWLLPATWTSQMTIHGIWSLASDKVSPRELYGVSWAMGANFAFTAGAIGAATEKRLGGLPYGIVEMVAMTPTIVVGLSKWTSSTTNLDDWPALTVWSGTLFLHGLASTVKGVIDAKKEKKEDDTEESKNARKNSFRVPFRYGAAPTLVSDGVQRVPGLMVSGSF